MPVMPVGNNAWPVFAISLSMSNAVDIGVLTRWQGCEAPTKLADKLVLCSRLIDKSRRGALGYFMARCL